ncbi:MAG: hypothetical protein AUJ98_07000 [Bacteroidetes bacterium CG2_30_33_31]|nr:MAG: hypothetical protein AUJ98_07000 [Bacteroidetes bacterium CG2_30_33_31]
MIEQTINIFIVDDHLMFIDGLKAILKLSPEIVVVGDATSGEEALQKIENLDIDVLLTDISMPKMKGDELCRLVKAKNSMIQILALTMHNNIEIIDTMIKAGVSGYILKNTGRKELLEAIHAIHEGRNFYSTEVQESMLKKYIKNGYQTIGDPSLNIETSVYFTRREKQIMKLIIEGNSNAEIAQILLLSIHTITSHRKNIYSKTSVNNTAQLIEFVRSNAIYL